MNILITGANGQLGSELRLLAPQHPNHKFLFTDVQELDITNETAVRSFIKEASVELIINCAAYTAVDKAESDQDLCHRLNAEAPGLLAHAISDAGGSIIHISTDYVFDGMAHIPYTEATPTHPNSTYGSTKLAGEEAVRKGCANSVIIRTAWLYSTFGNNFVKTMMRLGREREELGVIFDQIGTPTYARDLAEAILQIVEKGLVPGVYHFTNEGATSWYDFARLVHQLEGISTCRVRPLRTEEYPTPAARPHYSLLDKAKIKQTYGINIPWWQDALARCIEELQRKEG